MRMEILSEQLPYWQGYRFRVKDDPIIFARAKPLHWLWRWEITVTEAGIPRTCQLRQTTRQAIRHAIPLLFLGGEFVYAEGARSAGATSPQKPNAILCDFGGTQYLLRLHKNNRISLHKNSTQFGLVERSKFARGGTQAYTLFYDGALESDKLRLLTLLCLCANRFDHMVATLWVNQSGVGWSSVHAQRDDAPEQAQWQPPDCRLPTERGTRL